MAYSLWPSQHANVRGQEAVWLCDDAMISLDYGARWARGQGLMPRNGLKVEGYSNPLWVALAAGLCSVGVEGPALPAFFFCFCALLLAATAVAVGLLAQRLGASPWLALAPSIAILFSADLWMAAASGLETLASMTLMAWGAVAAFSHARYRNGVLVCAAGLSLNRFDGLVLGLALVGLAWQQAPKDFSWRRALIWVLAPVFLLQVFRLAYFGQWLPNTVILKSGSWSGKWLAGLVHVGELATIFPALLLLSCLGLYALKPRASGMIAAAFVASAGIAILGGGDYLGYSRFMLPLLPWLAAAAGLGLQRLSQRFGLWVLLPALAGLLWGHTWAPRAIDEFYRHQQDHAPDRVAAGLWLKAHAQPGEAVATAWPGIIAYYSGLDVVDLLGKSDPQIARGPAHGSNPYPGHNRWNMEHSLGQLKPSWVWVQKPWWDKTLQRPRFTAFDAATLGYPAFKLACGKPVFETVRGELFHCVWQ